jgi:hypothetical protein
MDYQKLKRMSAQDIKDLIKDVLHNKQFDPCDVDDNMHERLMRAVNDGEMDIHDMWQEGDGEQDVRFFKRKVEVVLRELIADERLEGCQHYAFREYKNAKGERILGGHSNGSVSFQIAQAHVGPGKVPISIVLYIDATFLKRGIPIRPIYCKFLYDKAYYICFFIFYILCYIILRMYDIAIHHYRYSILHSTYDIRYDIIYNMILHMI